MAALGFLCLLVAFGSACRFWILNSRRDAICLGNLHINRFGNLGRNVVIGPGFNNTDFSIIKGTKLTENQLIEFRWEVFDLFNHANFGQPGRVVGSANFGQITNTRFPTGDSGFVATDAVCVEV